VGDQTRGRGVWEADLSGEVSGGRGTLPMQTGEWAWSALDKARALPPDRGHLRPGGVRSCMGAFPATPPTSPAPSHPPDRRAPVTRSSPGSHVPILRLCPCPAVTRSLPTHKQLIVLIYVVPPKCCRWVMVLAGPADSATWQGGRF